MENQNTSKRPSTWGSVRNHMPPHKPKSVHFMISVIVIVMLTFLVIFILIFVSDPDAFEVKENKFTNAVYFWTTTTATVGFGDICPKKSYAKWITSIYNLIVFGLSMGVFWTLSDDKVKALAYKANPFSQKESRSSRDLSYER